MTRTGNLPEVVSREEWLAARQELLAKEKELTRARDRLNADRRRLPMVRIDKPYPFEGNTSLVAVSRAPYEKLAAFRDRMGWAFPWYSSYRSDFNYDFHTTLDDATELPAISAFLRVDDEVFHTYSTFDRGIQEFHNGYPYLDLTALGRQEEWEEPQGRAEPLGRQVGGPGMRLPDEYDDSGR